MIHFILKKFHPIINERYSVAKLIKLVGEGHIREFLVKEKTLKQLRTEARLRGFNDISKLK